jgi:hypothetical protein
MARRVTYGQLRHVLTELGFHENRRQEGVALEHRRSDTLFLFRPYEDNDPLQPAELFFVTKQLDERGLLEADSFKTSRSFARCTRRAEKS